ncbi:hypothetical protein NSTC745_01747 [Nostoc sp. DSM 114161]|jgi:hypothetical protein|uniref:hypothetical protein n=1 Tax=Nostoc sp. DSM 114161 TaxID=3440143 RepID=UPI0040463B6D
MEPLEYCRLYVKSPKPEKRGYRAACVRTLTQATFGVYSYQTIDKNWGSQFEKRPDTVLQILEVAHTINVIAIRLEEIQPAITELLEQVSAVAPYKKHK